MTPTEPPGRGLPTRPGLPPLSRRVKVLATAVIGLTLIALVADRRRPPAGELLVQADAADVRVTVRRNGLVVVRSTATRSFTLPPGDYEVTPDAAPRVALRAFPPRVTVVPNGRAVVRVEHAAAAAVNPDPRM